ncbi:hypothetical protein TR51_06630 [Kitasatospora griseola]|uniref:Uncharacterized protein n=1 Tax=Kitasatospora griseola TaxID=2064 RepID=A0A0D0PXA3_KITGR|nr:hypothetical protein TR51_06630 [Kitasatospora griseola]
MLLCFSELGGFSEDVSELFPGDGSSSGVSTSLVAPPWTVTLGMSSVSFVGLLLPHWGHCGTPTE